MSEDGDVMGHMLLPRGVWETALTNLERLSRIDAARALANETSDALTLHAPYSWLHVDRTVAPLQPPPTDIVVTAVTGRDGAMRRTGLAEARKRVGHTQATLAATVGVSKHTISEWETGNNTPNPRTRLRLAPALSLSRDDLDRLIKGEPLVPGADR
jgi:DNA-binding XRE family transcriptional regulator